MSCIKKNYPNKKNQNRIISMKDFADLLARIFIALIFLFEAYDSSVFFKKTKETMTQYGINWNQDFVLYAVIFMLVIGSVLVLIGYRSSLGAVLLLLYWIPVTFLVHSWWNDPAELQRETSMMFLKNVAIIGGLLMVYVNGSGKYSVKRLFATTTVPKL